VRFRPLFTLLEGKIAQSRYKEFRDRRPVESCTAESPFFLNIEHKVKPADKMWYKNRPMGHNKIGEILTIARKKFGLEGKVANHSVRKTGIGRLLDSNLPDVYIAQQVGMKSTDSLKSYKAPNKEHRVEISSILSGEKQELPVSSKTTEINCSKTTEINLSQEISSSRMFEGAIFKECTFNFGVDFGKKRKFDDE
jgi:hypothetical protein